MAMPLNYAVKTSFRRYKRNKWRTLFGILPFILLIITLVIFTNVTSSIEAYIQNKIIKQVEIKEGQIRIVKNGGEIISDPLSTKPDPLAYSKQEIIKVQGANHVEDVATQQSLSPVRAVTTDLVNNKELFIQNIKLAAEDSINPYTNEDFDYLPNQPIPIIINKNVFKHAYIDMQGADEITISQDEYRNDKLRREKYPLKVDFLKDIYNTNALLGKTFSVKFGGFPDIPQLSAETTNEPGVTSYRLRTQQELNKDLQARVDAISPYWNYDDINSGIIMEFQIAGFNEDQDSTANFIPAEAGAEVFQGLYKLQRSARTSLELQERNYGREFGGFRLAANNTISAFGFSNSVYAVEPPLEEFISAGSSLGFIDSADYVIPGWVYASKLTDGRNQPQELIDLQITPEIFPTTDIIAVLDDASNRLQTINDLIDQGFFELQNSGSIVDQARMAKVGFVRISSIIMAILVAISTLILISLVWRYVTDSQKEIGVYRALGARKIDIGIMYITYSLIQVVIGIVVGLSIGLLLIRPLADFIVNFIYQINVLPGLNSSGEYLNGIRLTLDRTDMYYLDWDSLSLYLGGLIIIAILSSIIPALRAAHVSPVEAIRNSD